MTIDLKNIPALGGFTLAAYRTSKGLHADFHKEGVVMFQDWPTEVEFEGRVYTLEEVVKSPERGMADGFENAEYV